MHRYALCLHQTLKIAFLGLVALSIVLSLSIHPVHASKTNEEIAISVATLLRSARAVISDRQQHINDPDIGDKGVTVDYVLATAKSNYLKATGNIPLSKPSDRPTLCGNIRCQR